MRMYYVFEVKKEILKLYKDNPIELFKILNNIYYMNLDESSYGFNLLNQVIKPIDKIELNRKIYLNMHNDLTYTKDGNNHIINNLYKDEISCLKVKNTHLLLECNKNYSDFFLILNHYKSGFFACDFKEQDYFFLSNLTSVANR